MASLFAKIHAQAEKAGIAPRTAQSQKWFFQKLKDMRSGVTQRKILNDSALTTRNKPLIGKMFQFIYDPKGKKTLPHYDTFPLIIMIGPAPGGFYGLNLHYLHPRVRAIFFDKLMDYTSDKRFDENTRLRLKYSMLSNTAKLKAFAPCFKHYLFSHVVSKTVEIPPSEWEIALFLPSDHFAKESKETIWRRTRKMVSEN
jgi:hypothetical protein